MCRALQIGRLGIRALHRAQVGKAMEEFPGFFLCLLYCIPSSVLDACLILVLRIALEVERR